MNFSTLIRLNVSFLFLCLSFCQQEQVSNRKGNDTSNIIANFDEEIDFILGSDLNFADDPNFFDEERGISEQEKQNTYNIGVYIKKIKGINSNKCDYTQAFSETEGGLDCAANWSAEAAETTAEGFREEVTSPTKTTFTKDYWDPTSSTGIFGSSKKRKKGWFGLASECENDTLEGDFSVHSIRFQVNGKTYTKKIAEQTHTLGNDEEAEYNLLVVPELQEEPMHILFDAKVSINIEMKEVKNTDGDKTLKSNAISARYNDFPMKDQVILGTTSNGCTAEVYFHIGEVIKPESGGTYTMYGIDEEDETEETDQKYLETED
tara:strand:- start:296 stop:1255 length:960 start_codon:yes stop_codon:yes gene_type:complete